MSSFSSGPWSPRYGSSIGQSTPSDINPPRSPSGYSYSSGSQRHSSDSDVHDMRRIVVSPAPDSHDDDSYNEENSIDEIQEALSNIDDQFDDTENALTEWSDSRPGSYTSSRPYTGSPSFTNLPHYSSDSSQTGSYLSSALSPPPPPFDSRVARLSRITERTEEPSRPNSGAFSNSAGRHSTLVPDHLRRSALLGTSGASPVRHSRSSTDPSGDKTLPPPGRATELISIFESQTSGSPASGHGHTRAASTPGFRADSPRFGPRSASPAKTASSSTTSYGSYIGSYSEKPMSTLLSPPSRPFTATGTRTYTDSQVGSTLESEYTHGTPYTPYTQGTPYTQTETPYSTNSNTLTDTRTYDSRTNTYTETGATTLTTMTPSHSTWTATQSRTATSSTVTPINTTLRKPQTSPRSPLTSVRNIVAMWKERSPGVAAKTARDGSPEKSPTKARPGSGEVLTKSREESPSYEEEGLVGIRRRMQRAGQRLRERESLGGGGTSPGGNENRGSSGSGNFRDSRSSMRSGKSGVLPPGFDLSQFSAYTQSEEPPLHIGLLWYLNVHAPPPYRWQRCQALLYPNMLLLSWLSPGGGRGIVALDLLNCTSVVSVPSPTHPSAREDVGTVAARLQMEEARDEVPLMDILVPFHMVYADGVERLGAESLGERSKWVNRLWDAINQPTTTPSRSMTRSPTGSIRTILSMSSSLSRSSSTTSGSRSTVFVPPLASIPDIDSYASSPTRSFTQTELSRRSSLMSSYLRESADDTFIRSNDEGYSYPPGDRRVITPRKARNRGRRSGSVGDLELDEAWKRESKVSQSSGEDLFYSASETRDSGSDISGTNSNVSSTYFSQDGDDSRSWTEGRTGSYTGTYTPMTRTEQTSSSAFTPTYTYSDSQTGTYLASTDHTSPTLTGLSPSTLSRTQAVRRRPGRAQSVSQSGSSVLSGTYDGSDKENSQVGSGSYVSGSGSGSYLSERSGSYASERSGSYVSERSGSYLSDGRSGSYTQSGTGTYTPDSGAGTFTPDTGTGTLTPQSGTEGSFTPSGSYVSRDGSSFSGSVPSLAGSGSYDSRSYDSRSGSYDTRSGSYDSRSGVSYSGSGSYTGTYTPSGSDTYSGGGSGNYTSDTYQDSSSDTIRDRRRGIGRTPISSSETGYDICMSSDFTSREVTPYGTTTEEESDTITPTTPVMATPIGVPLPSEPLSPIPDFYPRKNLVAVVQPPKEEYVPRPKVVDSDVASIRSVETFASLSSIPSFRTAKSVSSYETASEKQEPEETEYETAGVWQSEESESSELQEIPSEQSTPTLSSLSLKLEFQHPESAPTPAQIELTTPSTKSVSMPKSPSLIAPSSTKESTRSPSLVSDMPPEDIPLPPSVRTVSSVSSPPSPLPVTAESPSAPTPSTLILTESEVSTEPEHSLPDLPPAVRAASPVPSIPTTAPSLSDIRSESSHREEPVEVSDEHISLVSSLPPSITDSGSSTTSVVTPTSLDISSRGGTETIAPPSPQIPPTASSISMSTLSATLPMTESSVSMSTPSSLRAPSDRWAASTNRSYDSSILNPSPSVLSLALHDGQDASYETSFLRPSGSPSSVDRLSTLPASPFAISSVQRRSPLPPLTPVPALPPSLPSASEARTPSTLSSFSSVTPSSLSRSLSLSSSVTQSSLQSFITESQSLLASLQDEEAPVEEIPEVDLATEPSLLTTPASRLTTLTPDEAKTPTMPTPSGSVIMSITTPHGAGSTQRDSLRTVESESSSSEGVSRDLGADMDRLIDEIRRYDDVRGMENQELADSIRALRNELNDLSEYLHRTPSPREAPVQVVAPPFPVPVLTQRPRSVQLVDEAVGGDSVVSSLRPLGPRDMDPSVSLSRATSSASSIGSYLSSHHSDDDLLEEAELELPMMAEPVSLGSWTPASTTIPTSESDSDDYSGSSSELSEPSERYERPSSVATARPAPTPTIIMPEIPDYTVPLETILKRLGDLGDGQDALNRLIDELRDRPQAPVTDPELGARLNRIEDLIRGLIELQSHPRAAPPPPPEIIVQQQLSEPSDGSISESTTSQDRLRDIDRLRQLLQGMTPTESIHGPIPRHATSGPTLSTQLDEILSMGTTLPPAAPVQGPPPLIPFVYRPAERPRRSESPLTIDTLPARSWSEPPVTLADLPPHRARPRRERSDMYRRQPSEESESVISVQRPPPRAVAPSVEDTEAERILQDQRRLRDMQQRQPPASMPTAQPAPPPPPPMDRFHYGPGPTPRPVFSDFRDESRPPTAPAGLGAPPGKVPHSWYSKRPQKTSPAPVTQLEPSGIRQGEGAPPPPPPPSGAPAQPSGPPGGPSAPAGPTYVPMPAGPTVVQVPLFDSLMEILRENRLAQLATVDQQRELMRYMRGLNEWLERDVYDRQNELRGVMARVEALRDELRNMQTAGTETSSTTESPMIVNIPGQPPGPGMPQPQIPIGFQPTGYPQFPQPVIPPHTAPTPTIHAPVIPQPPATQGQSAQPILVMPQPPPVIPDMGPYGTAPSMHMPSHAPSRTEEGFIPPISPHSTGEPRPMRPYDGRFDGNVVVVDPDSTDTSIDIIDAGQATVGRDVAEGPALRHLGATPPLMFAILRHRRGMSAYHLLWTSRMLPQEQRPLRIVVVAVAVVEAAAEVAVEVAVVAQSPIEAADGRLLQPNKLLSRLLSFRLLSRRQCNLLSQFKLCQPGSLERRPFLLGLHPSTIILHPLSRQPLFKCLAWYGTKWVSTRDHTGQELFSLSLSFAFTFEVKIKVAAKGPFKIKVATNPANNTTAHSDAATAAYHYPRYSTFPVSFPVSLQVSLQVSSHNIHANSSAHDAATHGCTNADCDAANSAHDAANRWCSRNDANAAHGTCHCSNAKPKPQ
ncbi:hypothetical protein CC1G_15528 [Coprinopsis cinerea okayama7|uniref:PH domain-containing protein n=1 Tax=Coprinopsis cinerea (strain Okayama-7 / 130 / ATCC MYA-4618 / FGSC 9003) TaxID=240176 RepID=D6RN16_COPC7|nr:hypothetical protein CC1G_15528 [Coprinopsis cinerea okayama7\|eukprot:XP_002910987.1 hypothetical protein CC1G_15528 [Coprinopsis cinerea okayama7\